VFKETKPMTSTKDLPLFSWTVSHPQLDAATLTIAEAGAAADAAVSPNEAPIADVAGDKLIQPDADFIDSECDAAARSARDAVSNINEEPAGLNRLLGVSLSPPIPPEAQTHGSEANTDAHRSPELSDRPETLKEAFDRVVERGLLPPDVVVHVRSDLRIVAKVTGVPLDKLPCDPRELRPILSKVLPARHQMHRKRWATVKSSGARVLKLTGWHAPDAVLRAEFVEPWRSAVRRLPYGPQKAAFGKLARFCQRSGIAPEDVQDATLEHLRAWLLESTLDLDVGHAISAIRRHWNWLVLNHPGWPPNRLHAPRDSRAYAFETHRFRPSFLAALDELCDRMAKPSPFDPLFNRKYSIHTIKCVRGTLIRTASVLAQRGHMPLESITDLRAILTPAAVRAVLEHLYARLGKSGEWPPSAATHMVTLRRAARQCGALTKDEIAQLADMAKFIHPAKFGMRTRSREVVAAFDDDRILLRLFELPRECFRAADRMMTEGHPVKAATLYRRSLALAILLEKPLRLGALASLDVDRHIRRDTRGRVIGLSIPSHESKNGMSSEVVFSSELAERVELYLRAFRPRLKPAGSSALFPGRGVPHIDPQSLGRDLTRLVQSQIGIEFHPHAIRNLVATMILDDNARNAPVAQRMLDHASVKTTIRHYGQQRTRGAQREYNELLGRRLQKLRRERNSKTGKKPNSKLGKELNPKPGNEPNPKPGNEPSPKPGKSR